MQVAQGLLADITASAATLQNTVHDTSSKVAHMVALGGVTNNVLNWGWSLIVLLMVYHFHPKAAGYAAATLGKITIASLHEPLFTYSYRSLTACLNRRPPTLPQSHPYRGGVRDLGSRRSNGTHLPPAVVSLCPSGRCACVSIVLTLSSTRHLVLPPVQIIIPTRQSDFDPGAQAVENIIPLTYLRASHSQVEAYGVIP